MNRLRKLLSNASGAVSVEFVLIITLYIITCTTLFTVVDVFLASNKGYKANSLVSNISSRMNEMSAEEMDRLFTLYQNSATVGKDDAWMRMTAVWNNNGNFEVRWSVSTGGKSDCLSEGDAIIANYVPNVANGDEVLLLETSLDYSPIFGSTAFGDMTFNQRSTYIPRFVPKLDFPGFVLEEDCNYELDLSTDPDPGSELFVDAEEPTEVIIDDPDTI